MIAKQAATLDVLSGGRFELGLGAGAQWGAIEAMGGPRRSPGESVDALEEAIRIIRLFWSGEESISFEGRYYSVDGVHPGPPPAHPIGSGSAPTSRACSSLIGRMADGWVPSAPYAPPDVIPGMRDRIDRAAEEAGRDPSEIRRIYNVIGSLEDPSEWVETLSGVRRARLRHDRLLAAGRPRRADRAARGGGCSARVGARRAAAGATLPARGDQASCARMAPPGCSFVCTLT